MSNRAELKKLVPPVYVKYSTELERNIKKLSKDRSNNFDAEELKNLREFKDIISDATVDEEIPAGRIRDLGNKVYRYHLTHSRLGSVSTGGKMVGAWQLVFKINNPREVTFEKITRRHFS